VEKDRKLYEQLQKMENWEIQASITMMINYLVIDRNINLNEFLKEIKMIIKNIQKKRGKENE
jgi:hypothetical protein